MKRSFFFRRVRPPALALALDEPASGDAPTTGATAASERGRKAEAAARRSGLVFGFPRPARCADRLRGIFGVVIAVLLGLGWQPAWGQVPVSDKISGEILAHQRVKLRPPARSIEDHRDNLRSDGLNPLNETAEDCALYTTHRLSPGEILEFAAKGIRVTPNLWIPPVPGKHPRGFHLATVNFASLDLVRADPRIVQLESTESEIYPLNDLGAIMINADEVHAGVGVTARTGNGIKIAVADTGVDLTHGDLPPPVEAYDMTKGTDPSTWGTSVANLVSPHGTHVSATAVGRGVLSGGKYKGSAPGASFYFYKIANDTNATASTTDEIEAINRAVTVGANIFTMSFGGISTFMDGSEPAEQAIDAAVAAGTVVFISAGNDGVAAKHDSASVGPGATSAAFGFTVVNPSASLAYSAQQTIRVIWRDGNPSDANIALACSNLGPGETLTQAFSGFSARSTEGKRYVLTPNLAAGASKTYSFTLQNTAVSGPTTLVHCYQAGGIGVFANPDPSYTVGSPAIADGAIAVGAWTQRKTWTNHLGSGFQYADLVVGTLAPFSSQGPRIDGTLKPEIVAPGAATISARDSAPGLAATAALIIDNDGLNLNGSGPSNYYIMRGTSMAAPMAAGVAALILESNPALTPTQVRQILTATASLGGAPNTAAGFGLIDALAAVSSAPEIDVQGNGISITSGDLAPGAGDGTDFGAVVVGQVLERTFTIKNTGNEPLNLTGSPAKVAVSGTGASAFSVTTQPTSPVQAVSGMTTFVVRFTPAAGQAYSAQLAIANDDANENPYTFAIQGTASTSTALRFAQADHSIAEPAGTVALSVTRTGGSAGAVSVHYASANGTAVAPGDYTDTAGTLNWADGDSAAKLITVPIVNDGTAESSESFTVTLSNPTGGALLGSPTTATVTIVDDDASTSDPAYVTGTVLGSGRNNYTGWVGMQIVVGANPLAVSQLSRIMAPGNSGTHAVKLVRVSDGADVPGGGVTVAMSGGAVGEFRYGTLSSPVTLAAGTAYLVLSLETAGGDSWYDWDTRLTTTDVAVDNAVAWGTGPGDWHTLAVANQAHGPVSFRYTGTVLPLERTLTVTSANPNSGVGILVSPADRGGQGNGVTAFTRTYASHTVVTLTATATVNGNSFQKWQRDGADWSTSLTTTATMDADHTLNAIYGEESAYVTGTVLGSGRNNYSGWVGLQIVVGANPLSVSQLGRITAPGNSGTHAVKLVKVSDGADVPGGGVTVAMSGAPVGEFRYGTLSSPVMLAAGTAYLVLSLETAGGDAWYDWDTRLTTTDVALDNAVAWGTGPGDWHTLAVANQAHGPVNFKYASTVLPIERTLTVNSANPNTGVSILVSPADHGGQANGVTAFTRTYASQTVVTLTAAATANGNSFQKWQRDGADWATSLTTTATMDADHTLTAIYAGEAAYVTGTVLGTPRNNYTGWVGMQIVVGADALAVSQLGRMMAPGNSGLHALKLVKASDGTDVPGGSVTVSMSGGPLGEFIYGLLSSSVTLTAHTAYLVLSQESVGGDTWYDWDTRLTTTNVADDSAIAWGTGPGDWHTYAVANQAHVPVNFKYANAPSEYVTGTELGTLRNNYSGWVGLQIMVGANPLTVSQLGRITAPGNVGSHALKLVKASDGMDVPGGAVNVAMSGGTVGEFRYGVLSSPVTLAAGTAYLVLSLESAGGDAWYDWDTRLTTTDVAEDNAVAWGTGPGDWHTFPVTNQAHGPVNFRY